MALKKMIRSAVAAAACLAAVGSASAGLAVATWTDWENVNGRTATGSMGGISVSVSALNNIDGLSQTACGENFWTQPNLARPAYTGGDLANAPTPCEQLGLNSHNTVTVTFGSEVNALYMAVLSVGRHEQQVTYDFDQPFVVDSNGVGYWSGGVPGAVALGAGDTITMSEGHGVLRFSAPVSSLSFTVATDEWWHAVTFGTVPEPGSLALVGAALAGLALRRRRGVASR